MILVTTVHWTPPPPTRPRVWAPNAGGLFVPDIERTEGGIYVSVATMDEVEAELAARRVVGMIWWGFKAPTYCDDGQGR